MFLSVIEARYLSDYRILLTFSDGKRKIVNLEGRLTGPMFKPLIDLQYFEKFSIHFNTIEWPNGADFAPEFLYEIGQSQYPENSIAAEQ